MHCYFETKDYSSTHSFNQSVSFIHSINQLASFIQSISHLPSFIQSISHLHSFIQSISHLPSFIHSISHLHSFIQSISHLPSFIQSIKHSPSFSHSAIVGRSLKLGQISRIKDHKQRPPRHLAATMTSPRYRYHNDAAMPPPTRQLLPHHDRYCRRHRCLLSQPP